MFSTNLSTHSVEKDDEFVTDNTWLGSSRHRRRPKWIRSWHEGACFPSTIRPAVFAVFPVEQGNPVVVFGQSAGAPDVRNWITAPLPGRRERGVVPNIPNVSEHQRRCAAAFMTSKAEWSAAGGPPSLHQRE